ncbi:MAG: helix-turn-helix transcriptional regulator [Clostridia bacterium]|nr:helix-turn-helix transcriptional regulator [Clostridia bacterium]
MFDITKFGGYLSRLRKNADMTQSELADKLNVTHQAVSRYENGHCFPDISVLVQITEIFGVTLDELINSGEPTKGESRILGSVATGDSDVIADDFSDIVSLAPILKPSVLAKLSEKFSEQGIDISGIVLLAEYLNDETVLSLLENAEYDSLDRDMLEKFLPVLDIKAKTKIFEKIIEGKLHWHFIEILLPHAEFLTSHIEAAVIEGALPKETLEVLYRHFWDEKGYKNRR